jgi:hypothetical protein
MSGEQLRDFFNKNFVDQDSQKPLEAHFSLTVSLVGGESVQLPAVKTTAATTLYEIFHSVNEYLKSQGNTPQTEQPGEAPGAATMLDLVEIKHANKLYFVEVYDQDKIIIQDSNRKVLEEGSAYSGVLKKYKALTESRAKKM